MVLLGKLLFPGDLAMILLFAPLVLFVLPAPTSSQDSTPTAAPAVPDVSSEAAADVLRRASRRDLVFEGEASIEEPPVLPEVEQNQVRVIGLELNQDQPFVGSFEFVSFATGERLVSTETSCPGFVFYAKGERRLRRLTYGDEPPAVSPSAEEWSRLFDLLALAQEVEKAEVNARVTDKRTVYSGALPSSWLPKLKKAEGQNWGIQAPELRVLTMEFELIANAEGELVQILFSLQRNDPMKEFNVQFMDNGGKKKAGPHLGQRSTYSVHVIDMEPTKRSRAALEEFRRLDRELGLQGK